MGPTIKKPNSKPKGAAPGETNLAGERRGTSEEDVIMRYIHS